MKIHGFATSLVLGLALLGSVSTAAVASSADSAEEEAAIEATLAEERPVEDGGETSYDSFDCYLDCRLSGLSMKFCWIACTASPWPF